MCAAVFFFTYPETKGKSLEEIDEIFGDIKLHHPIAATPVGEDDKVLEDETVEVAKSRV